MRRLRTSKGKCFAQGHKAVLAMPGPSPGAPDSPPRAHPLPFVFPRCMSLVPFIRGWQRKPSLSSWELGLLLGFFQTSLRRPGHLSTPPGMFCLGESSCTRTRRPQRPLPRREHSWRARDKEGRDECTPGPAFFRGWGWGSEGRGPCPAPRLLSIWA